MRINLVRKQINVDIIEKINRACIRDFKIEIILTLIFTIIFRLETDSVDNKIK